MKNILKATFFAGSFGLASFGSLHAQDKVTVHNADELIAAIRPGAKIELAADTFRLRDISRIRNFPVDTEGTFLLNQYVSYLPGNGIVIHGVKGLTITGSYNEKRQHSVLSSRDEGDFILTFRNCQNIRISEFEANHIPRAEGGCSGGVLFFDSCSNVQLMDAVLIGSGRCGIQCDNVDKLSCLLVTIDECSSGLFELSGSSNLAFEGCSFQKTKSTSGLTFVENCHGVSFTDCTFTGNHSDKSTDYYKPENDCLIRFYNDKTSTDFSVTKCTFTDNTILHFTNRKEIVVRKENTFTGSNGLQEGE